MLESRDIVRRPLVTEKTTYLQDALHQYVFLVHRDANRLQVKKAVEELFKVKVEKVRTMVRKGKPRRAYGRPITTDRDRLRDGGAETPQWPSSSTSRLRPDAAAAPSPTARRSPAARA
jgi:ribosomal protein L23